MAARRGCSRSFVAFAMRPASRAFSLSQALTTPLTAEELAKKIRTQKEQQRKPQNEVPEDPVKKRVKELKQFTQQLQRVHPNVLAKALKQGIVFQNTEIVVINKPYGLPVHGGPKVKMCITDVLPILAKMLFGMKAEPLHLCHRLDKETTGVMVLARNEEVAHQIHEFFRTRKVEKKYWAICVGQPEPAEGIVDIPIVEKEVERGQLHFKMTLAPKYHLSFQDGKMSRVPQDRDSQMAVTRYRTLSNLASGTLIELQPITGVKHQLRVHLAYGLGCPILGDHKYSHWDKLAPQKLPPGALKKLGLVQAKARHLPLHLHAYKLSLPELNGSEEKKINLVCKPPHFFNLSLKRLNLEIPKLEGEL
uniref:Pseudouridylate synthase RPUSD4, mitochondrial n=1 Tax=Pogona vitticeps TaxID=103695 RepID=A0A6J0V4R3_9SAUR